jgi:hypothetical protein
MATRAAKTTAKKTATPAKKTTAARAPRTRKTTTAKTTTPARLSLVKPTDDRGTVVDLRYPLKARRRLFVGPMGSTEQAAIRAALDSARIALPVPVSSWTGSTANLADGLILTHNPGPDRYFTAHIACPHGAIHGWPISSHADLRRARAITRACGSRHAANMPGDDGTELDWDKATTYGTRHNRVTEGVQTARKANADTQPLSESEIAAHIAQQLADTETPKGHPQP